MIFMGLEKKLKEVRIDYSVFEYKVKSFFHEIALSVERKLAQFGLEIVGKAFLNAVAPLVGTLDRKAHTIRNSSASVILLRGGAYLNDVWKEYHILVNANYVIRNKPDSTLVIAPQSYLFTTTKFPEFFMDIRQEVHLFCRERYSYDKCCGMCFPENVHIYLSPDTALYLTKEDFDLQKSEHESDYLLIAPRKDRESAVTWNLGARDLRKKTLVGDVMEVRDFRSFLDLVWNASEIHTDRLHVAILSAILGKETRLYPNIYYKNKGVYEFSLCTFPNVKFIDSYKYASEN